MAGKWLETGYLLDLMEMEITSRGCEATRGSGGALPNLFAASGIAERRKCYPEGLQERSDQQSEREVHRAQASREELVELIARAIREDGTRQAAEKGV